MPFNSIGQYTPTHKTWDHVGNKLPRVEHSAGIRPAHPFRPAAWLPVQFKDKHYENWNVVMPGKLVACDPDGYLMPAEYGLTSATVEYTQNDIDAGVIDIATGEAVTTAKTVTLSELDGTEQKGSSGWTKAAAGTSGNASSFMGRGGEQFYDAVKKYPIGVASAAYLQWAGGDGFNPADYRQHNFNMQHQVPVLCDYVLSLPLIPGQVANETISKTVSVSDLAFGTSGTHTRANAEANKRYDETDGTYPVLNTYPVIALALDEYPIAKRTTRTPLTLDSSTAADDADLATILANEKSGLSGITQAGDYWVDEEVGVIFIYSSDGTTVPTAISSASGTVRLDYFHYATAPGTVSKFASVVATTTELRCGDFLKVGANSNFLRADPSSDDVGQIVAQVLGFETHPQDGLDRVRTAYSPAISTDASGAMSNATLGTSSVGVGQLDQMPGSATGGYPASIHYAGGADLLVVLNLIFR